ncbi:GerAB/ArcD/ProY family transporter [Paenibacillus sp. KS-LC4]|uniref:GerAB/ArcD/ProY family transporter n=1 Tax=Paenibacillus sp. KS-LC4 TaxID=2979727 RepID=UPI0030CF2967
MIKQKISSFQMGVLFFVFMTGSSIIFVPGPLIGKAGAAAWLSLLLSGLVGFGILMMLLYLYRRFPGLDYIDYSRRLMGNGLTVLLGLLTISYLLQMQAAIVIGVGQFMIGAMMRETPMYAFTSLIFLIAGLTARAGIEVIARMFTLIMLLTSFFIAIVLLFAIPVYQPDQLLPILPKGLTPVFAGAYYTFGFPYSEVFLFGMLLPFAAGPKVQKKLMMSLSISFALNLIVLCAVTLCSLMVFGSSAGAGPYVLYSIARLIEFQEIFQRVESIIGMSLILGSYMKATLALYVLSLFITKLCGMKDNNVLIMPLALTGFLLGLVTYDSTTQWGHIVTEIHPLWTGFVLLIPLLIVMTIAIFRPAKT